MSVVDHDVRIVQIVVRKHYLVLVGAKYAIQAFEVEKTPVAYLDVSVAERQVEIFFAVKWTCGGGTLAKRLIDRDLELIIVPESLV